MMSFRKLLVLAGLALVPLAPLTASCSAEVLPPKGQLMLVITTNLAPPKDFDTVHVRVIEEGANAPVLDVDYALTGSQAIKLPATLGIVAGSDPNKIVRVTVEGRKGATVRVQRHATSRVPQNRIAALQLPIDGLCLDQTPCPGGTADELQTCIVGSCQPAKVEVEDLPTFSTAAVFGGAEQACFDTLGCFAAGRSAVVRTSDCSLEKEPGAGFNVAVLARQPGDGICGSNACLLPLDKDPFNGPVVTGWRESAGRVLVPKAVCERSLPLLFTTVCPTKNAPTCGPWSAVGSGSGLAADASVPVGDATFPDGSSSEAGLGDAGSPTAPRLSYSDQDPAQNMVAGTAVIGRAADESGLTGYELYWGDGPNKKRDLIAKLQKTGGDLTHPVTGPVLPGATHLIAFAANAAGPIGPGVPVGPIDNYPRYTNITINGPEIDEPIALMDPAGDTIMVVGFDAAAGRKYPVLIRCKLDGSGCTYTNIAADYPTVANEVWKLGAVIDPVAKKLLVTSDYVPGGYGLTLFRCDLDGANCARLTIPAPLGFSGESQQCSLPTLVDAVNQKLVIVRSWSSGKTFMHRCALDGTSCTSVLIGGSTFARCQTAFLRPAESRILVLQLGGSINPRLVRCTYDGSSCNDELLDPVVFSEVTGVIDEANQKFLAIGQDTNDHRFTLVRCNLDGTGCAKRVFDTTDDSAPTHPAAVIDPVHQRLFTFGLTGGSVGRYYRCALDGTDCSSVVSTPTALSGGRHPSTLLHNGTIYTVSSANFGGLQMASFAAY